MKKKLVIFHPAIAPYRIDFFNSLNEHFEASFYFEFRNALEQSFDQEKLRERQTFQSRYLKPGLMGIKNLRLEAWSILRREKPDLVFVSEYNLLGLLVCLYKILCSRQLGIVTVCDDNLVMASGAGVVKRLTRWVMLHILSGVILVDTKVKSWYERHLPYKARYLFFPIVQDERIFHERLSQSLPYSRELMERYGLKGKRVVLYVGRFAKVKNLSLLLDAFKVIHDLYADVALVLVGAGDERNSLEELSARYQLRDVVVFAGKQEGEALMAHYNLGDIFVLPSTFEPFGTVVNEALLSGCYTLCSSVAGAACLISSENGACFDPKKRKDLEEALKKALSRVEPMCDVVVKRNLMVDSYSTLMANLLEQLDS